MKALLSWISQFVFVRLSTKRGQMNSSQVQFPTVTAKFNIMIISKDDYKYLFVLFVISYHNLFGSFYLRNWPLVFYEFFFEVTSKLKL